MEEIKNLLNEAIIAELNELSSLSPGSEEKARAIEDFVKLYKLRIDEIKTDLEHDDKRERRFMDTEQLDSEIANRQNQLAEQIKDRYFRVGIAAAEIVLPMLFYAAWMRRGFRFEETGTYTSTTFRGLFNRFKPTKR